MINKSSDEYATLFCLNKSRSCWELDKENKAIETRMVKKTACPLPTASPDRVSQAQMSLGFSRDTKFAAGGVPPPSQGCPL